MFGIQNSLLAQILDVPPRQCAFHYPHPQSQSEESYQLREHRAINRHLDLVLVSFSHNMFVLNTYHWKVMGHWLLHLQALPSASVRRLVPACRTIWSRAQVIERSDHLVDSCMLCNSVGILKCAWWGKSKVSCDIRQSPIFLAIRCGCGPCFRRLFEF
jgi:hypothetical protein